MPSAIDISVVVASVEAGASIDRCLAAVTRACTTLRAQIIVADASRDDTADRVAARWPDVELLRRPPGTLVPVLWGDGFRRAQGRVVAFTIGQMIVASSWGGALLSALDEGTAQGVGGPLDIDEASGPVDWAVFFLRYSAFTSRFLPAGPVTGEIAGDNAAYLKIALDRHAQSFVDGFWELDFHHRLRAEGGRLAAAAGAAAMLTRATPLWSMARHRWAHGRTFGASRVAMGVGRLRMVAAAPVVPFVLARRAYGRIRDTPAHRRRFLPALPFFMVLAACWSLGEAAGALLGAATRPRAAD